MYSNSGGVWSAVEKGIRNWFLYVGNLRDARYGVTRRILDRGDSLVQIPYLRCLEGREALNDKLLEPFSKASSDYQAIKMSKLTDGAMGVATGYFTRTHSGECSRVAATGEEVGDSSRTSGG